MLQFHEVYTRKGRLNKRQTILKMAERLGYKFFTACEVSSAIETATGGEVKVEVSLCDLVLRKRYNKLENSSYFSKEAPHVQA
jgi:hypothetical protein